MQLGIIAHINRREWAESLQRLVGGEVFCDDGSLGSFGNHVRALQWASTLNDRAIIFEDDALPVRHFHLQAKEWLDRFPDDLISFYLGTGRPPQYQNLIRQKLERDSGDFIALPNLIHGVCYSVPPNGLKRVLAGVMKGQGIDFAIGRAWGRNVIYPKLSLVDHRDEASIENHPDGQPRIERRKAWGLSGELMQCLIQVQN